MKIIKVVLIITMLAMSNGAHAHNSLHQQITSQIYLYVEGWAAQNGEYFARPFSKNSVFINIFATRFNGKEAIAKRHQEIFDTFLSGTMLEVVNTDINRISKNVAIVYVDWKLHNLNCVQGRPCPRNGIFTHVFKKRKNGKWKIVSTHNTHAIP